jgi:hypothetical protein
MVNSLHWTSTGVGPGTRSVSKRAVRIRTGLYLRLHNRRKLLHSRQPRSPAEILTSVTYSGGVPKRPEPVQRTFQTHDLAPETGIYRVVHLAHRLPHEVVVLKEERFPRCAKCDDAVIFELVHAAPDLFAYLHRRTFELNVLDEDETSAPADL